MIYDDFNIQLSAYADGELSATERVAVEARLAESPALRLMLAQITKLGTAAKTEAVPELFDLAEKNWPLVTERTISLSSKFNEKLSALALSEACPELTADRTQAAWQNISGRALRAFKEEHLLNVPKVSDENWSKSWKHITTRMRAVAIVPPVMSEPAPVVVPLRPVKIAPRPVSIWSWVTASGLAAAAMLALVFSAPQIPQSPENELAGASMAMSIPESQDERYGVLVKYVPGSDDPVICLYKK